MDREEQVGVPRFGSGAPPYQRDEPVVAAGENDPKAALVAEPIADRARDRQGNGLLCATPDRAYRARIMAAMTGIDNDDIRLLDAVGVYGGGHRQQDDAELTNSHRVAFRLGSSKPAGCRSHWLSSVG